LNKNILYNLVLLQKILFHSKITQKMSTFSFNSALNDDDEDEEEEIETANDLFKILITPIQAELVGILKEKLFDKLRRKYSDVIVASNNEQSHVQPHNLSELNSVRVVLRTQKMHSHESVHDFIQAFLVEFFDLYAIKGALKNLLPPINIYKRIRKNLTSIIQWATFGGDHAPRFTPGMPTDFFSENYKINCWAHRNVNNEFDEFDSFVIGKSDSKMNALRKFLEKFKFKANFPNIV